MFCDKDFEIFAMNIENALRGVGAKYEVAFEVKDINMRGGTIKLGVAGIGEVAERARFEEFAAQFGYMAEDYRKQFYVNGEYWEIVGFDVDMPDTPIIIESVERKKYKVPTDYLK